MVEKRILPRMSYSLARDVRNHLSVIKISSNLSLAQLEPERRIRGQFKVIGRNAKRACRIVDNFLGVTRSQRFRSRKIRLDRILNSVYSLALQDANSHVRLVKKYDSKLPQVKADPSWLRQTLFSLVINSMEAMQGEGTLTISADYRHTPGAVHIVIAGTDAGLNGRNLRMGITLPRLSKSDRHICRETMQ